MTTDQFFWRFLGFWALLFLVYAMLQGCTRQERILVKDRYWQSEVRVSYTKWVTQNVCSTDTDGNLSCQLETRNKRFTRCTSNDHGRELPVTYPDPSCTVHSDDDIDHYRTFLVRYVSDGGKESVARFPEHLWDNFEPGFNRLVEVNILGNIRGLKSE